MTNKQQVDHALSARKNSYSPYSKFRVGACVLCESDNYYTGCNIENATYGATCCAERVAIYSAIAAGEKEFTSIAIASDSEDFTLPCGICRQIMYEFSSELEIICANNKGEYKAYSINELLPHAFKL